MATLLDKAYRFLIVAACVVAIARFVVWERAEALLSKGMPDTVARALQLEPDNADMLARIVSYRQHNGDVAWITTLTDRELHRFRYPSVVEKRAEIRTKYDGTQPREPAMPGRALRWWPTK